MKQFWKMGIIETASMLGTSTWDVGISCSILPAVTFLRSRGFFLRSASSSPWEASLQGPYATLYGSPLSYSWVRMMLISYSRSLWKLTELLKSSFPGLFVCCLIAKPTKKITVTIKGTGLFNIFNIMFTCWIKILFLSLGDYYNFVIEKYIY